MLPLLVTSFPYARISARSVLPYLYMLLLLLNAPWLGSYSPIGSITGFDVSGLVDMRQDAARYMDSAKARVRDTPGELLRRRPSDGGIKSERGE